MIAFFRLIRIANLLIIALTVSFFFYLILVPVHFDKLHTTLLPFTHFEFCVFVCSIVLITAAGNVINDFLDFEADKKFGAIRPLCTGPFSLDQAMYLHAVFLFTGIGLGFYIGWGANNFKVGYLYVIAALLSYLYSSYLKKIPLIGNILLGLLYAFPLVLLIMFESLFLNTIHFENGELAFVILLTQLKYYGGFIFLITLARDIVKDIESEEGDAAMNIRTLAVQFGENISKIVATMVIVVLLVALLFLLKALWGTSSIRQFFYLLIAIAVPLFVTTVLLFLAKEREQYSLISRFLSLVWLLGILSIPAFYFFSK